MEIQLNESWKDKAVVESSTDNGFEYGYLQGASDFQEQAVKELEKYLDELPATLNVKYYKSLHTAIKIIKELKAE